MSWNDPSPRNRGRAPAPASANPGYGAPAPTGGRGVSLATILARSAAALGAGALVYMGAHAGLSAWHGHAAAHATADKGVALVLAILAAALLLRHLSNPASWRPGDGLGWLGGRRRQAWDDGYNRSYPTLGEQVVADVVEGAVEGIFRAID